MDNQAYRLAHDSMGEMKVPIDAYWGAQTQRSLQNFQIGLEKMPLALVRALAMIKQAAAITNDKLGRLDQQRCQLIEQVCQEIIAGTLDEHFPLAVWQTGSGTQTNMNLNEVIANRGNEIAGEDLLHPNDHVNMSQSSNDTFPSAMHLAIISQFYSKLLPQLDALIDTMDELAQRYQEVIKVGRTHLQDATPITFGQEVSGWAYSLKQNRKMLAQALENLSELAIGGTAVGTGLNAPKDFGDLVAEELSHLSGYTLVSSPNKFHALSSKDELVFAHGGLKSLAGDLMKIANDIRWLASGPRCGLGEITIPSNEPGSSIMPGKVNPTQAEAVTMVAVQVIGNDATIGMAASQGNFELNVYMPVIIYNFLQSIDLLSDAMASFNKNCVQGIQVNQERMTHYLDQSLMLVTRLNPIIGYEKAAQTAQKAFVENITLKEACISLGFLSEQAFDEYMKPEEMI